MGTTMETGTDAAAAAEVRDTIDLPPCDALDAILAEQERFDTSIDEDPEEKASDLGKTRLEARYEIPALAALHHKRRQIARALAPLAALFEGGQTSMADARRKQHRNLIASLIATEQKLEGDRQEAKLERLANADERHLQFCDDLHAMHTKYVLGRVALMEVNEEIRDREEAHRTANAELRAGISPALGAAA